MFSEVLSFEKLIEERKGRKMFGGGERGLST